MELISLKKDKLQETLSITITNSDIDNISSEILIDLKAKSNIKGFRAGKAPISFLVQQYESSIVESIVDGCINLIQNSYQKYINENKIHKAILDKIDYKSYEDGQLKLELTFESIPKMEFGKLSEISLTRPKIKVEEKQLKDFIDSAVKNARKYNKNEDKNYQAKHEDLAVVSFIAKTEKSPIIKDAKIDVSPEKIESEVISKLANKKVGEKFKIENLEEVKHVFGADFDKITDVEVELKEIHTKEKMEANDDLAKFYNLENLEALENIGKTKIKSENSMIANSYVRKCLLDNLDKTIQAELPSKLINQEVEQIKSQLTKEDKITDEEVEKLAKRRVKLGLAVSDIASAHNIKVTKEDIEDLIQSTNPASSQQMAELISKNSNFRQQVIASIIENKVINFLINQADISEKDMTLEEVEKELEK